MHHDHSPAETDRQDTSSNREHDRRYRQAVLTLILAEHPCQLSAEELGRELEPDGRFAEIDAVSRAVDFLVGSGLLRREGASVLPTRAALAFMDLECQ